ncbi:hypothetical protein BS420_15740 [Cronobacter sakazakii]|nr:hypothetical protein BS420_15740 [Cronobacter sakazakii]
MSPNMMLARTRPRSFAGAFFMPTRSYQIWSLSCLYRAAQMKMPRIVSVFRRPVKGEQDDRRHRSRYHQ